MSDSNWALLMGAVAVIQSIRAEWNARVASGYKAAAQNKYNEGFIAGGEDQSGWEAEADEYRDLIIDIIRNAIIPQRSEDE